MVNENASLVKYEPPKCDECGRKIVVLSDLCAKCAAGIELNGKKQANRPGTNPLPTWPKPPAPPNPPPVKPVQTNQNPCQNCQPGTICKKPSCGRLKQAQPVQPAGAQGEPVAWAETDEHGEIAWGEEGCFSNDPAWIENPIPLYTAPPAAEINAEHLEALRKRFVKLPKYSFLLNESGGVARVPDRSGAWVEWYEVHQLFDPVVADAAIAAAEAEKAKGSV